MEPSLRFIDVRGMFDAMNNFPKLDKTTMRAIKMRAFMRKKSMDRLDYTDEDSITFRLTDESMKEMKTYNMVFISRRWSKEERIIKETVDGIVETLRKIESMNIFLMSTVVLWIDTLAFDQKKISAGVDEEVLKIYTIPYVLQMCKGLLCVDKADNPIQHSAWCFTECVLFSYKIILNCKRMVEEEDVDSISDDIMIGETIKLHHTINLLHSLIHTNRDILRDSTDLNHVVVPADAHRINGVIFDMSMWADYLNSGSAMRKSLSDNEVMVELIDKNKTTIILDERKPSEIILIMNMFSKMKRSMNVLHNTLESSESDKLFISMFKVCVRYVLVMIRNIRFKNYSAEYINSEVLIKTSFSQ